MSKCPDCKAELDDADSICPNCGAVVSQDDHQTSLQKGTTSSMLGDKNVIAGDVVGKKIAGDVVNEKEDTSVSPMIGDKNVIAGDVIGQKVMGNVIYNVVHDETKHVNICSICGHHITNDTGHTCPRCKTIVCSDCFDSAQQCCKKCVQEASGEIIVDQTGYGDVQTITDAIEKAKANSFIRVKFGRYNENLSINKPLTIVGEENEHNEKPVIIGIYKKNTDIIEIKAQATLKNLSITTEIADGSEKESFISIYDDAYIENCDILPKHNSTINGITIKSSLSTTIKSCRIEGSSHGCTNGILLLNDSRAAIENCDIWGDYDNGIIMENDSSVSIKNCKIHDFVSNFASGIKFEDDASGVIEHCDIFKIGGNGISMHNSSSRTISDCKIHKTRTAIDIFSDNDNFDAITEIKNCEMFENDGYAISISDDSHPSVTNCKIYKNGLGGIDISESGGDYNDCDIFENNHNGISILGCGEEGLISHANPTIHRCNIHENYGAGIYISGQGKPEDNEYEEDNICDAKPTIIRCNIYNNEHAGIYISGMNGCDTNPTVVECKIQKGKKEGIFIEEGSNAKIEACDIFDNKENIHKESSIPKQALKGNSANSSQLNKELSASSTTKISDLTKKQISSFSKATTNNKAIISKSLSKTTEKNEPKTSDTKSEETIDPRRLTDIDWYKKTPTTLEAWNALTEEQKKDWAIWNRIKTEYLFAMAAMLLEIVIAITVIACSDFGVGMSVLVAVAAFAVVISTAIFRKAFYNALRALVAGGLVGSLAAVITCIFVEEGTLRTIIVILLYVACITLFGFIVSKGGLDRKIPKFPERKG